MNLAPEMLTQLESPQPVIPSGACTVWYRAERGICFLCSSAKSRFLVASLIGMTWPLDDFRGSAVGDLEMSAEGANYLSPGPTAWVNDVSAVAVYKP